jgi:hypothetical protein
MNMDTDGDLPDREETLHMIKNTPVQYGNKEYHAQLPLPPNLQISRVYVRDLLIVADRERNKWVADGLLDLFSPLARVLKITIPITEDSESNYRHYGKDAYVFLTPIPGRRGLGKQREDKLTVRLWGNHPITTAWHKDPPCSRCHSSGHLPANCPLLANAMCYECGAYGHQYRFCPVVRYKARKQHNHASPSIPNSHINPRQPGPNSSGARTHVVLPQEDCVNESESDRSVDYPLTQLPIEGTPLSSSEASSSHTVSSIQYIAQTPSTTQPSTIDEFTRLLTDSQLAEALDTQSASTQSTDPDPCSTASHVSATPTSTNTTPSPVSMIPSTISTVLATSQSEDSITHDPHEIVNDTEMASVGATEGSKTRGVIHGSVSGSHSFDPYNRGDADEDFSVVGRNGRKLRSSNVPPATVSSGRSGLSPASNSPVLTPPNNRKNNKKIKKKQTQIDSAPQLVVVQ